MEKTRDILDNANILIKKHEFLGNFFIRYSKNFLIFLCCLLLLSYAIFVIFQNIYISSLLSFLSLAVYIYILKKFYDQTFLIVTDTKILKSVRSGLFSSHIIELPLERVRQIRANNSGVFAKLFGYGDLEIQGFEESSNMYFKSMKNNKQVMADISKILQARENN